MMVFLRQYWLPLLFVAAGLGVLGLYLVQSGSPGGVALATAEPTMTYTPEPVIPTRTPVVVEEELDGVASAEVVSTSTPTRIPATRAAELPAPTATPASVATSSAAEDVAPTPAAGLGAEPTSVPTSAPTLEPTLEPTIEPTIEPAAEPAAVDLSISRAERFGVTGALSLAGPALEAGLPFGSYLNWTFAQERLFTGVNYWQMVRTGPGGIRNTTWDELASAVGNQPGAIWVVGNEPDVPWQDGVTPERYAEIYHDVYTFIKDRDPSAAVAIAGVSQSTPLRRAYLDRVLTHYQAVYGMPMPIDIWNVHAFTLREEADSWGIGIPPGMEGSTGILYEIDDHANTGIWKQNITDFRVWMAARGYGDKPLAVTEFGILLPSDYGFPPDVVADFMRETIGWMQSAGDGSGYSADGGRYVQWWFWYSIQDSGLYPTGDLFDPATGSLTEVGRTYRQLVTGQ